MSSNYIIIGGGVVGCAAALELAQHGAGVTILEQGRIGSESSWAGGGILSPLLPWDYQEPVTRLTQWSAALYPEWITSLLAATGINPEYQVSGMLVLPEFDLNKAIDWSHKNELQVEQVTARNLVLELGLDVPALWLPEVSQVRNPRLMSALVKRLALAGVRVLENIKVTDFEREGNKISGVNTSQGQFSGEQFIVSGGAWSKQVLGDLAPTLPIRPIRGQMLLFKLKPGELAHIVLQNGIYLIPRQDGHILVGSTLEDVGFDKSTTQDAAKLLHVAAARIFPRLAQENPVLHWAGLRPGSPDNIPVIARHPAIENLYVNSGHFRYGVTMAQGSARLLCNMLLDRPQPFDVSPYKWPE